MGDHMNDYDECRHGGGFIKEIICPCCNKRMNANIPKKPPGGFFNDSPTNHQRCPHCGTDVCVTRHSDGSIGVGLY